MLHKTSGENLAADNRELNLFNKINDIILRNHDEFELYTEVCNCIMQWGGYKLTWICHKPDANAGQTITSLAQAGARDYLEEIKISRDDPGLSKGPTAIALNTDKTFVNNDITHTTNFGPWPEIAKKYGICSVLVLVLDLGKGKKGAISIYSGNIDAFDEHEVYMLERLAANLSIAVQNIENRNILIESENRFRSAFEDAAIGMGLVSPAGKWIKVNRSIYEMLGYTEQELLSLTFQEITHPEDLEKDVELLYKTLRGEIDTYRMEKRYFHKNGNIVWINLNASLVRGADKQPLYFISQIENITERVESQLKFQNLVENFIVGVYILKNGKFVYVNQTFLEETGYAEEELINMPFDKLVYKDDLEHVKKIIDARANGLIDTARYEVRIVKKDAQPLWFEILGSTTTYKGAPALMGTIVNISERKAVYEELIKSEANLRSIFDSTDVSYLLLDTKYNIVSLNQQMTDIYQINVGITLKEGDNLIGLITPERQQNRRELFDGVVQTKKPSGYETSFTNNGFTRHFAASVFPIVVGDETIGICISTIDVTEAKNALENLKAANKNLQKKTKELEVSNTELEQFAYVASHDLQEPLRMVNSFLTQLEKKYGDTLDEKGKKYIYFATDGAKRMRQLILDLLEFSRVGRMESSPEEVDFTNLINEVLALFRRNIEELGAKIQFDGPPTLRIYKTPLRQVLQNLLANALKYHKPGIAPVIEISAKETSANLQFSIKDNGIGIDPEYFDQIFIIFKRLHNRDIYPGTGMGLAITKKIVESMGGRIWVDSREGEGAVFHFTIPKETKL